MTRETIQIENGFGNDNNSYPMQKDGIYKKNTYEYSVCKPIREGINGWKKGKKYRIQVAKLWNNRFCIYKQSTSGLNFNLDVKNDSSDNHTGYKVYDDIQSMKQDFEMNSDYFLIFTADIPQEKHHYSKR